MLLLPFPHTGQMLQRHEVGDLNLSCVRGHSLKDGTNSSEDTPTTFVAEWEHLGRTVLFVETLHPTLWQHGTLK